MLLVSVLRIAGVPRFLARRYDVGPEARALRIVIDRCRFCPSSATRISMCIRLLAA